MQGSFDRLLRTQETVRAPTQAGGSHGSRQLSSVGRAMLS